MSNAVVEQSAVVGMTGADVAVFERLRDHAWSGADRPVLNWVLFDGTRACATDGRRLVVIEHRSACMAVLAAKGKRLIADLSGRHNVDLAYRMAVPVVRTDDGQWELPHGFGLYPRIEAVIPDHSSVGAGDWESRPVWQWLHDCYWPKGTPDDCRRLTLQAVGDDKTDVTLDADMAGSIVQSLQDGPESEVKVWAPEYLSPIVWRGRDGFAVQMPKRFAAV